MAAPDHERPLRVAAREILSTSDVVEKKLTSLQCRQEPFVIRGEVENELFPSSAWRCLLPGPSPVSVVIVGFGPASIAAARLWSARRIVDESGSAEPRIENCEADLVVAGLFDQSTLAEVRRMLGPEGVAYLETDWPLGRRTGWFRRRIERAGLEVGPMYAIAVGADRWTPSWWIPVGDSAATRFVARTGRNKHSERSLRRRLGDLPGRLAARLPQLVSRHPLLLHPRRFHRVGIVVAGTDPRSPAGGPPPDLQPALRPGGGRSPTSVAMRIGGSSTDQPILFYFDGADSSRDGEPTTVVKAPTRTEEIAAGRHEADVLGRLADRHTPVSGVPRPVPVVGASGYNAWGQTYAAGTDLATLATPARLPDLAAAVADWTTQLAQRTAEPTSASVIAGWRRSIEHVALGLAELHDGDELAGGVVAAFDRISHTKSVIHHGDLGPWNVHLTSDGSPTVLDWADSTVDGIPACDLIHFLAHLCLCAHDAYRGERRSLIIGRLMDPTSDCGRLTAHHTRDYATKVGLQVHRIDDYRIVTWALDLLDRPPSEWDSGLYLELLRAEIRRTTPKP